MDISVAAGLQKPDMLDHTIRRYQNRAIEAPQVIEELIALGTQMREASVETIRNNVPIDWTLRENVRAHLRVLVKRILRKHGHPPAKQEKATQTVREQAEVLSAEWTMA